MPRPEDVKNHLQASRVQVETVTSAMAQAVALLSAVEHTSPEGMDGETPLEIVIGVAQGFTGTYNKRLVAAVLASEPATREREFSLIGQRCTSDFELRGIQPIWSANMLADSAEVPTRASAIVDALFARITYRKISSVTLAYSNPEHPG